MNNTNTHTSIHTTIHVGGMTCGGCVNSVRRVLEALPSVINVDVSLENAQAEADFDPQQTPRDALLTAIKNAGFDAR